MAKKFTKLFLGDVVKTVGSKVFKKLITEQPKDDTIVGTWLFNEYINVNGAAWYAVDFTSNGTTYIAMSDKRSETSSVHDMSLKYFKSATSYDTAFSGGSEAFTKEAYRTINITTEPTDEEFIAWLKANATKQSASTPTLISFTIGGTKYQAEEGMEWASWVGSAYNTHGYFMEGIAIYDSDYTRIYYQPYTSANITIYGSDIILANGTYGTFQSMSGGSN